MSEELTKRWDDIWFFAIAEPHEYHADFMVYEIYEQYVRNPDDSLVPDPEMHLITMEDRWPTTDRTKAQVYLHGYIKWDGCSNWNFDEQDTGCMLHFCSTDDTDNLSVLFRRLYEWAAEIVPKWDHKNVLQ